MLNYRVEVDYATLLAQKNAEKFPNQPLMLHTYQLALMVQQRFKDAMDVIDQTLKTDPNHVDTLLNQAYIYRIFGHFDLARSAVERALSLSPEYIPSLEELAELLKSTNQDASVVEKKIQDLRKQNKFANELELKSSL
jgi:tetratricopeptide (TPR) repeat protein